ncbi:MAG: quinone oxidoreductase [Myxococcales bacterium]|nr:quinone oxidoreductase [Myxococcales bacterium]MCB9531939.1 quinone oxidoreductase [Myxococcales bacterium]MCB9533907.1 quinone oxidoreductase [Myxococcales bacterium]
MPATPYSIVISEVGGPEVLRRERIAVTEPGWREVRIRQTSVGVNFIDVYHRKGLYALPSYPHGIGMEAAGVVDAVGEGVSGFAVGDRVAYSAGPPGAYATHRTLPVERVISLPDAISDGLAASSLLKGMTVEALIRRVAPVSAGMTVLWHAAAGGVGAIACQWLAHLGVEVIGTVGSAKKADVAFANGCTHVIDRSREDVSDRVREITRGVGVPIVFDSVGHATFEESLSSLARRGMLVAFGNSSGKPDPFDPMEFARRGSLFFTRPTLWDYIVTRAELEGSSAALFDVLARGIVKLPAPRAYSLARAADAHRALESGTTVGASILTV